MRSLLGLNFAFVVLMASSGGAGAGEAPPVALGAQPIAALLPPAGEGRRLFLKLNCYGCHGMRAAGGMGPNIVGAELRDVTEVVQGGSELGMPAFRAYTTKTDLANLTAYLQSIGTPNEPMFVDWWQPIPSR